MLHILNYDVKSNEFKYKLNKEDYEGLTFRLFTTYVVYIGDETRTPLIIS
jgi:hypothetical protein